MGQNREITFRATAVSGIMTNFLTLLAEEADAGPDPEVAETPTAELTLRVHAGSEEEEKKLLEGWRKFGLGYHHSQIKFLEPEIRLTCDSLTPLGPDD